MKMFKTRFSKSEKVVSPVGIEPAQQQFKDDCDINSIMRRFQKTGAIDHVAAHQLQYGMATPTDYHQAMNIITRAEQMFADLPSSLRRRFNGDPAELLEFVQDPKNAAEAKELGLALSDKAAGEAAALEAAASEAPGAPKSELAGAVTGPEGQQAPASE
jgi:phage internal scaffolding protein